MAAGPNGAEPHHTPSQRRARSGELVVVDFGARVDGYCSDMTRTVVAGSGDEAPVPEELRRIAAVVACAPRTPASRRCATGCCGAEVDRACREVVEAAGLGEFFVHGTGHGVGLDVHEAPAVGPAVGGYTLLWSGS